jgi:murein DD-endopeptidase MepM/ murein hydrolase activator NlpD
MVVHDRDPLAPPPVSPNPTSKTLKRTRQAWSTPAPPRRETERAMAAGDVVEASTDVYENYEVQRGDHVDALARAFATTRRTIVEANGLHAPFALHPGQIVKVPVAKAYVARSGDTLPEVARRFSINVDELAELNHLSAHAQLRPGQELGLPSSMRDRGPQRTETEAPQYAEAIAPRPTPAPAVRRDEPGAKATYFAHPYVAGPAQAAPPPEHRIAALGSSAPPVQVERGSGYATTVPPAVAAQAALSDTEIAQAARGRFVWPVRGDIVVRFGQQGIGRRNDGVDIKAAEGTVVKAAAQGEVVYAGDQVPGFGNLVLIKHADGWVTAYAHLQSVDVQMRQQVVQGQSLGQVGTTGGVPEPELHFEVRFAPSPTDKARPVDPVLVLPVG